MRHRDKIVCIDSEKAHLCRLPNFEPNEIPPRVENLSKKGLVIIPLFGATTGSAAYVKSVGLISALWARRSWLLNSDAMDYGIEVKLYMENHFRENAEIMSILDTNGVTDADILWFDGSFVEGAVPVSDKAGTYLARSAKVCTVYTNRQMEDYDWIFMADSDLFVIKSGEHRLPFFSDFFKSVYDPDLSGQDRPYNLMSFYVNDKPPAPPYQTEKVLARVQFSSVEEWKADFEALLGSDMLDRYCNPDRWFMIPHSSLHAFPAKHFMRERWDDCEFLIKIARIMISDEQTLSVWHSLGHEIGDLSRTLDNCPMHMVVEPNVGYTVDEVHSLFDAGIPYIIHFGAITLESIWREGIGAI